MTGPQRYELDEASGVDLSTPVHRLRTSKGGREIAVASGRMESTSAEARNTQVRRRRRQTKWKARRFIAWDGEGITVNGRHRYVILANSEGDALVNPEGLHTGECLDLLLERAGKDRLATHVIFAGSYDVNMILRPVLARHQARILANEGRTTIRTNGKRYRVEYHPRHTFSVREEWWEDETETLHKERSMVLWDVFGSFQSSFVKACARTLPESDLSDLDEIQRMKGLRSRFTVADIDEMLTYCRAELRSLVRLAECDRDNFEAAGFQTSRWDGAGAKASALLHHGHVAKHKETHSGELTVPIRGAYAGGRIEQLRFGDYSGDLFTVDIRSAYPYAATKLPTLRGGTWVPMSSRSLPETDEEYSVWHVRYRSKDVDGFHPLFWRSRWGNIHYPSDTEGWYWAPEVRAAIMHMPQGASLDIIDGWRFHPATDEKPFGFIPELFAKRKELDAQVKGRGWPLKLALNSLYGKMAQQIGGKDGVAPRWHQLDWAGWITSFTRGTMYRIAAPRSDRLVSVQTDGLTFLGRPDDMLSRLASPQIGGLEIEEFTAGTFVQSGIYWLRDDEGWHDPKVRGVGDKDPDTGLPILTRETFVNRWASGDYSGAVTVPVTRFRGLVTSSLTPHRWAEWCQWVTEPRDIRVAPEGKRVHAFDDCTGCRGSVTLHDTWPTGGGSRSGLHRLSFESTMGRTIEDLWWLDSLADADDSLGEE